MAEYTVTAVLTVQTDAGKAQVQALLDQGLKELPGIASRYGFTVTGTKLTVEE
jgi:hypothetical protein